MMMDEKRQTRRFVLSLVALSSRKEENLSFSSLSKKKGERKKKRPQNRINSPQDKKLRALSLALTHTCWCEPRNAIKRGRADEAVFV